MQSGPFEWKAALFAGRVRVQMDGTSISITENRKTKKVEYLSIESVYFSRLYISPFMHSLHTEIVQRNGESIRFGASGYGLPQGFDAEECRKATIAFLLHFENVVSDAKVYEGQRPTPFLRWLFIGIWAAIIIYIAVRMFLDSPPEEYLITLIVTSLSSLILAFFGWRQVRKLAKLDAIPAKAAREGLELVQHEA